MLGRRYNIPFDNVSVSAAQDFWEIQPADDKPVRIMKVRLSNVGGTADAGDAQEELWRLSIVRGHTTSGSGGSSPTVSNVDRNGASAGFTAEINNTTIASTSGTTVWTGGFNVRVPDVWEWTPEERITASQADTTIVFRLLSTPADAVSMSGVMTVEEF